MCVGWINGDSWSCVPPVAFILHSCSAFRTSWIAVVIEITEKLFNKTIKLKTIHCFHCCISLKKEPECWKRLYMHNSTFLFVILREASAKISIFGSLRIFNLYYSLSQTFVLILSVSLLEAKQLYNTRSLVAVFQFDFHKKMWSIQSKQVFGKTGVWIKHSGGKT